MANESEPVGIGEDAGAAARILQEQYYLIYQLPNFINKPVAPPSSPLANGWDSFSYPEELEEGNSVLHNAFFKTKSMKVLNKMAPSLLSSLIPEIRLFKIFYSPDGKQVSFNWEIPFTDFVDPNDPKTILEGKRGTVGGVNIIDFQYDFIGTNKAEAETSLIAKLNLKFSSIDSLLTTIYIDASGKILPNEVGSVFSFRYSDLVNQESRFDKDFPSQFNKKYYRLKAVVGLRGDKTTIENIADSGQFIGVDGSTQNFAGNAELVTKAVNSTRAVLHLYPIGHTLNFEEDGTISLNIEFRSAIESIFNDEEAGDLFLSTNKGQALFKRIQQFKEKKLLDKERLKTVKELDGEESFKSEKEKLDEADKKEQDEIDNERSTFLTDFLGDMFYNPSNTNNAIALKKMKYTQNLKDASGSPRSLLQDLGGTEGIFGDEQETNKQVLAAIREGNLFRASQGNIAIEFLDEDELRSKTSKIKEKLKGKKPSDIDPKELQEFSMEDEEQVTFFYVGDILHYFLSKCIENFRASVPAQDVPKFVIGNIPLIVPLEVGAAIRADASVGSWGSVGTIFKSITGKEFTTFTVNISRIPISYNYFLKWYIDTVLKTKKQKYPIHIFMNDITNLIQRAVLNVYGFNESSLLNTRTVNLGITVNADLYNKLNNGKQSYKPLFGAGSFEDGVLNAGVVAQTRNLHVLYTNAIPITNINTSDLLLNEDRGIFTFTVGKNVGLLKSLKFNRMEMPFVKEARMTQEGSLTRGVLLMKYNATLRLYGACVFRPGDIVVINPVFLSGGKFLSPAAIASGDINNAVQKVLINELGLGGVYCVTKCGTSLGAGKAETTIECVFQAYGAGDLSNVNPVAAASPSIQRAPSSFTNTVSNTSETISLAAQQTWKDIQAAQTYRGGLSETFKLAVSQTISDIKNFFGGSGE